jgi:hypothetical protein
MHAAEAAVRLKQIGIGAVILLPERVRRLPDSVLLRR